MRSGSPKYLVHLRRIVPAEAGIRDTALGLELVHSLSTLVVSCIILWMTSIDTMST
jgi:hypothetical protein